MEVYTPLQLGQVKIRSKQSTLTLIYLHLDLDINDI